MEFEEKLKLGYEEYLKLPLATIQEETEIYANLWCTLTGLAFVSPDPHRHYTFLEFVFYCGRDNTLYNKFIKHYNK